MTLKREHKAVEQVRNRRETEPSGHSISTLHALRLSMCNQTWIGLLSAATRARVANKPEVDVFSLLGSAAAGGGFT